MVGKRAVAGRTEGFFKEVVDDSRDEIVDEFVLSDDSVYEVERLVDMRVRKVSQ